MISVSISMPKKRIVWRYLSLLEKLCFELELADWNGIGFVTQAYQKRCPLVIDYLVDLESRSRRRPMIRLVQGPTGMAQSNTLK